LSAAAAGNHREELPIISCYANYGLRHLDDVRRVCRVLQVVRFPQLGGWDMQGSEFAWPGPP